MIENARNWTNRNTLEVREVGVDFGEVVKWLKHGGCASVPEWQGFWTLDMETNEILAHTKDQTVIVATHFQKNVLRTDWILYN